MAFVPRNAFSGGKLIYRWRYFPRRAKDLLNASVRVHSTRTGAATHPSKFWTIVDGSTSACQTGLRLELRQSRKIVREVRAGRCSEIGECGSPRSRSAPARSSRARDIVRRREIRPE